MLMLKLNPSERKEYLSIYRSLSCQTKDFIDREQKAYVKAVWTKALSEGKIDFSIKGINPLLHVMQVAQMLSQDIGMRRSSVLSALLYEPELLNRISLEEVEKKLGTSALGIIRGLKRVNELYHRDAAFESENFRNLLLSFAQDGRVILIMIADRVVTMRSLHHYPLDMQEKISKEAFFLFAPLAHRMGLYALKTELEDLSLKFTQPAVYEEIERKLAETKAVREDYIAHFIRPIKAKIQESLNLPFEIKGRTKSVYSIWNKLRKQQIPFEKVYDIFAIRIIIDVPPEEEKSACWHAFSLVTDMYQPNPSRTKDWLSIPKSNGYESLHTTVLGPDGKWVEVQIRSARMDEIAERGLAAHWKYKGIKSEKGIDEMLTHIREILENQDEDRMIEDFKMELYEQEIYVFTPKGELMKLPSGATVLDFAYSIHTNLGSKCVGARVNGKNVPIRYVLKSGDSVEVQTASTQVPKQDWLHVVVTAKARNKIKQTLKELKQKQAEFGRENLSRRMKNRKLEWDETYISKLIKRLKMKTVTDFYAEIGSGRLDVNHVIDTYMEISQPEKSSEISVSAGQYTLDPASLSESSHPKEDVLVIDQNLKGLDFKLAKCCNPIYGDNVFGFVSVSGGIRIHRDDCPNAAQMRSRFAYRIVKARWAGKAGGSQYPALLQVIGNDDIGIVTNITSLISKESNIALRAIRIDSNDGLFNGHLTLMVSDTLQLDALIKKIKTIKGVKQVRRD